MLNVTVRNATVDDADAIAIMVNDLLHEVMRETRVAHFDVNVERTKKQARNFIEDETYVVFLAVLPKQQEPLGFLSVYECCALYAGGSFGVIPECYVRPEFRSQGIGHMLIAAVKNFGKEKGWTRLEVTTPPLPMFQQTVSFYAKEDFEVSGGKKLKVLI